MSWLQVEGRLLLGNQQREVRIHAEQESLAITGPSGIGKTSLLRAIAGVGSFDGRIEVFGELWHQGESIVVPAWKRRAAWVPQESRLFPHLRVAANLAFGGADPRAVSEIARWLSVQDLLDRFPRSLSGGEAQRVALGRAMLASPRLLLLDEPFAALEPPLRARLGAELKERCREAGIRVVLVTHDRADVTSLVDDKLVLD